MQIYLPEIDDDFNHFHPQAFVSEQSLPSLPMSCSLWSISRQYGSCYLNFTWLFISFRVTLRQLVYLQGSAKLFSGSGSLRRCKCFPCHQIFRWYCQFLIRVFWCTKPDWFTPSVILTLQKLLKFTEWFSVSLNKNLKKRVAFWEPLLSL